MKLPAILAAAGLLAGAGVGQAATVHLLLESNADKASGAEVFRADYASQADFLAGFTGSSGFLDQDIGGDFSIADLAYDNGVFRLLLESNADKDGGSELFVANYDSYADLLANNASSTSFLPEDIGSGFSVHGFTYGDGALHLLLESNADADGGAELFLASYASYADLLGNSVSSTSFLQQDIGSGFSVAGLGFDAGAYQLLLESNADADSGAELFLASYASLADFKTGFTSATTFLPQDIGADFSVHGLEYEPAATTGGVPEPAAWALMVLGFAAVGAARRAASPSGLGPG